MKNFEKFEEKVKQIVHSNKPIAVVNNKPCVCEGKCTECKFDKNKGDMRGCILKTFEWLYEEYKEPIKLTRLEYELLKYFSKSFRYADKDEVVVFYNNDDDFLNLEEWGEDLFAFLFRGGELEIQDILNNCEVIEDVD